MTESNSTLPPVSSTAADKPETTQPSGATDSTPKKTEQASPDTSTAKQETVTQSPSDPTATSHKSARTAGSGQPPGNRPPTKKASGKSRFALFLGLLALVLLAAASLYFWQKQTQQNIRIEQLLQQSKEQNQELGTLQRGIQQKFNTLDERLFEQQNNLSSLSQQAFFNSQKLADLGARSRMDWLLAEAEYLMRLANQRLTLEHDIQSAEAMLSSADSILAEINDPGLSEIRQTLATEIISLQQIRHLDYQGLYFRLEALITSLDSLKQQTLLGSTERETNASTEISDSSTNTENNEANRLVALWQRIWQDLKQAVSIRRLDQPLPPLLAPEQHYYLTQNLRLMLEQASLALLDAETQVYQSSLKKASAWLNQYFMQSDPQIQQIQESLHDMAQYQINQALPDISRSLRLTKAKIESFYRQHSLDKLSSPNTETAPASSQKPATPEPQQGPVDHNEEAVL